MSTHTDANRTEVNSALEESVHRALANYRLGHVNAQTKQVLVDEAFTQFRRALAARRATDWKPAHE